MNDQCVRTSAGWCEEQEVPGAAEQRGSYGRRFFGPGGFCESGSEDWHERCLTSGCAMRLVHSLDCRPTSQPKPPARPVY